MKRLYRDRSDEMIAGVCSGIGKYLDVDPTAIRLAFVLLLFVGGGGLWIYLILWIIMPLEPGTDEEKIKVDVVEKKSIEKKVSVSKQAAAKKTPPKKAASKKPAAKSPAPKRVIPTTDSSTNEK